MMPMCACSICDECARAALTEAENNNNACPSCGEPDNSPEDLIPCRKVREKVNEFKSKMNSGAAKVRNIIAILGKLDWFSSMKTMIAWSQTYLISLITAVLLSKDEGRG